MQETWVQYLVERVPWRRGRQPIPVFLLGDFHGHRNLVGYSPCGHKHLNTTEQLTRRRQWHPTPVFLPGKSHGRRCLVGCSPWGHEESGQDWATSLSLFTFMHWRRKWQPTPVFLPGESQGWGRRVGHEWSDLAAAAEQLTHTHSFRNNATALFFAIFASLWWS